MHTLLMKPWFVLLARIVLTFVFWSAGLFGIFDFAGRVAEMQAYSLPLPELTAVVVTVLQLGGSLAIILNRFAWLGAGSLSVFLLLTVPIAHAFWNMPEPQSTFEFFVVLEHVSLIGGLMIAACLGAMSTSSSAEAK